MTGMNEKYKVAISISNKRSKKTVNTFKVRKNGNSSIVTVSDEVKEELDIKDGDQIQYVTVKNENEDPIVLLKKSKKKNINNSKIDDEVKETFENSMDKYDDIITALAEL